MIIDFIVGAFLAGSPWLLDFSDIVFWPHLVLELGEMIVAAMTDITPQEKFNRGDVGRLYL